MNNDNKSNQQRPMKYNNTLLIIKLICRKQLQLLEYTSNSQNRTQLSYMQEKKKKPNQD